MQKFKYKGTVHQIGNVQTFASGFKKRTLVLANKGEKWDFYAAFDFTREHVNDLNGLAKGEEVVVEFTLDAFESKTNKGSWFSSARAVGLARPSIQPEAPSQAGAAPASEDDPDAIPF